MSELAAQKDEILAIRSIFESDNLIVDEDCRRGVFLASPVLPNPPMTITYSLGQSEGSSDDRKESFSVNYLPPIEFQFVLPAHYPSKDPPHFKISCEWLDNSTLTKVCQHLDDLWNEFKSEILYSWFYFLLHDIINYLDFGSTMDITKLINSAKRRYEPHQYRKEKRKNEKATKNNNLEISTHKDYKCVISSSNSGQLESKHQLYNTRGVKYFDQRARSIRMEKDLINRLKSFDSARKKESFANSRIDCGICFSSFFGSEMIAFSCDHYYCKTCIKTYLETLISEGQVNSLTCPCSNCDNTADPEMVKNLVKPELYQKYDSILLSSAISRFEGVVFCPRKYCLKPILTGSDSESNKVIVCPYCEYAFCSYCRCSYHPASPCKDFADENEAVTVLTEYGSSSEEKKRSLEKMYGRDFLISQFSEFKSKEWLKKNQSKRCPNCSFFIEKIEGCNKIHCFRCNINFCWLCLTKLRNDNPYLHFRERTSNCYAKLFEGVIERDEDDDDEEWEEMDDDLLFVD